MSEDSALRSALAAGVSGVMARILRPPLDTQRGNQRRRLWAVCEVEIAPRSMGCLDGKAETGAIPSGIARIFTDASRKAPATDGISNFAYSPLSCSVAVALLCAAAVSSRPFHVVCLLCSLWRTAHIRRPVLSPVRPDRR